MDLKPYAMWTNDCQGKQDYDGGLLSISTRYYPGPGGGGFMMFNSATGEMSTKPYGKTPSAHSSIILRIGPREEHDGGGDYLVWRDADFEAATEAEVKGLVETWVTAQMADVVALLGGAPAFRNPYPTAG